MTPDVTKEYLDELIADHNFVAAILAIKRERARLGELLFDEYLGRITGALVADLDSSPSRDKAVYLRSMLRLIFQEVPELERVYRDQLREERGRQDLLRNAVDGLRSLAGNPSEAGRRVEEGFSDIRRELKRGLDRDKVDESVRTVLGDVEKGLRDGLDLFADVFQGMVGGRTSGDAAGDDEGSSERRVGPEPGDGASVKVEVEVESEGPSGKKGAHKSDGSG